MNSGRSNRWITISNFLSLARLLLAPVIVWALLDKQWPLACGLFVVASVTDLLDGYLARRLKEQTVVGHYLDPVADKVLLLSSFSALAYVHLQTIALPFWFLGMVVMREVIILSGSIFIVLRYPKATVEPSFLGKLTTASYMFLIMWIFLCYFAGWLPSKSFSVAVFVVAFIAVASLFHYCSRGLRAMRFSDKSC